MTNLLYIIVFIILVLRGTTGSTQLTYRAPSSTVVVPYQHFTLYPTIITCASSRGKNRDSTTQITITLNDYPPRSHDTQLSSSLHASTIVLTPIITTPCHTISKHIHIYTEYLTVSIFTFLSVNNNTPLSLQQHNTRMSYLEPTVSGVTICYQSYDRRSPKYKHLYNLCIDELVAAAWLALYMQQIDIAASCVNSVAYLYTLVHTRWLVAYAIACMKSNRASFCQTRMIHQLAKVYKTQCCQAVGDALPYVVSNSSMTDVAPKLQSHSPIPIDLNYTSKGHNSDPSKFESKHTFSQLPLSLSLPIAYNNTSTTLPLSLPLATAYNNTPTTLPLSLPIPTAYNNTSTTLPLSLPLSTAYNNTSTTLPPPLPLHTAYDNTSTTLPLSLPLPTAYINTSTTLPLSLPLPTAYNNTSTTLPLSLPLPTAYNNTSTTLPLSLPLPTAYNNTSTTLPLSLPLPTAYNNTSTTLPLSLPLPTAYNNISTTLPLSLPLSTAMHNTSTTLPLSFGSNNTYITLSQSHFGPEYSSDNAGDGPSIKSVDSTSATRGGGRYNLRRVSLCPPSLKQREAKELTTTANKSTSSSQSKVSKDKGNTHSIVELAINTCACIIESKTYKYTT